MFHAYGAYVVLLREEFGWSRTLLSAAFSMARAESGILGPVQGWLTDRFGPRALMRVGLVIFGLGFILFSQIGSPLTFFLTFFMMALGSGLAGYLPIGTAIVAWFRRRRALALSIASTGMAIGGLLVQVVALALTRWGWRWTAFASGVVVLLLGLPLVQVIRHRPEPYGLRPDGDPPEPEPRSERAIPPVPAGAPAARREAVHLVRSSRDFTAREAMRCPAFWYVSIGHASAILVVSAVMVHLIVHLTERLGYSLRQAAAVLALLTVMQVVGQLAGGWAGDRVSKRALVIACMAAHVGGLFLLAHASAFWMAATFAVVHGLAWGVRGPLMSAIRADYFGTASFGAITGLSSMVVMLGMMAGPLVAGIVADRTGSYTPGFQILAALAAVGSVSWVLARRPEAPR